MTTCSVAMPKGAIDVRVQWAWWRPGWQCAYLDSSGRVVKLARPGEVTLAGEEAAAARAQNSAFVASSASIARWSTTIAGHRIVCGGRRYPSCTDRGRRRGPPWAYAFAAGSSSKALAIRSLPTYERRLLATRDGGRHWRAVRSPCPRPLGSLQSIALPSPGRGWLLCVGQPAVGQQEKAVYFTTDLGRHWKPVAEVRFDRRRVDFGGLGGGGYPEGISFLADGHGMLWESRGTLFLTRDGGQHWFTKPRVVRPQVDSGLWAEMLSPRHALELLISARGYRLIASFDNGRSWRTLHRWRGATPVQGAALRSNAVHKFCASRIRGDFDGDGRTDSAVAFSSRSVCDAMEGRSWYLVVRLSRGGHLRRPLGHDLAAFSEGRIGCEPLCFVRAAPDFNRDGRDEIEVSLQQGAALEQRGIYGLVGNRIRRFGSRPAGQPLTFSYGGSLRYGAGVVCRTQRGRHLVVAAEYGYRSEYGRHRIPVTEHVYQFEGRTFVHLRDQRRVYRGSAALPPRVPGDRC